MMKSERQTEIKCRCNISNAAQEAMAYAPPSEINACVAQR